MGDTTFRTLAPGKIVVSDKAAPPKYDYEEDEIARNVRADEFGGVNTLVPVVLDAAKKGFPAKERGQSAANLFTQHNTGILCTGGVAHGDFHGDGVGRRRRVEPLPAG